MSLVSTDQDDFSTGIYSGRKAPKNAIYDLVNGLINDEGLPFRRGGSEFKSNADAGATLDMLTDSFTAAGRRTIFSSETDSNLFVLDPADDATPLSVANAVYSVRALSRAAAAAGVLFFPSAPGANYPVRAYAGSLLDTETLDAASVTEDSATVTGTATSWMTTIDPGMLVSLDGNRYVVREVVSDTELSLFTPYRGATDASVVFASGPFLSVDAAVFGDYGVDSSEGVYVTTVGTRQRLIVAVRQRAFISAPNDPFTFTADSYLEVPSDGEIIGTDAIQDSAVLWTTKGVWRLSNLDLDSVDAFGNVAWQQSQISKDVILWGDAGVAAWAGAFLVPALDDVYVFAADGTTQPVSTAIRQRYRPYVKAGLRPGVAAVHEGHYFLPILDGLELVDTLICRLDRGQAWTRWAGHAASIAYARRTGGETGEPQLLGLSEERVTDLTGCMDPTSDNATDATGGTSDFVLTTRDYPTGANQPGFAQRLRARYEMAGAESPATDLFERADEDPLGSPYLAWRRPSKPKIVSGSVIGQPALFGLGAVGDTTRPEVTGPACFSQIDLDAPMAADGDTIFYVGARLTAHSSSANGYSLWLEPSGSSWLPKIRRGSTNTTIAAGATISGSVEGLRLECRGPALIGLVKISGAWVEAVDSVDGTYTAAGYVGFGVNSNLGTPSGIEAFSFGALTTVIPEFSSDEDDDAYTELGDRGEQGGGGGWGDSDGSLYQWADVRKKRERIRFRLTVTGATSSFILRSLELLARPSGKQ